MLPRLSRRRTARCALTRPGPQRLPCRRMTRVHCRFQRSVQLRVQLPGRAVPPRHRHLPGYQMPLPGHWRHRLARSPPLHRGPGRCGPDQTVLQRLSCLQAVPMRGRYPHPERAGVNLPVRPTVPVRRSRLVRAGRPRPCSADPRASSRPFRPRHPSVRPVFPLGCPAVPSRRPRPMLRRACSAVRSPRFQRCRSRDCRVRWSVGFLRLSAHRARWGPRCLSRFAHPGLLIRCRDRTGVWWGSSTRSARTARAC